MLRSDRRLRAVSLVTFIALTFAACSRESGGPDGDDDDDGTSTPTTTPTATPTPGTCGDVPSFEDGIAPTSEIHVAPGGDDDAGDGTEQSPYATLTRAAQDATPGAAIRLHPGVHAPDQYLSDLAGTAVAPIWIGGVPGEEKPRFEGGTEAIHLTRVRHLVLHDIEITGQGANGINIDDGSAYDDFEATRHLILRGLDVHDVGPGGNQDCLKLSGVNDFLLRDSRLVDCGQSGSGVDMVGCHDGLLLRNVISGDMDSGIQAKGGSARIELRANRIAGGLRPANLGGSTGLEFFRPPLSTTEPNAEAREIHMIANVVSGGDCSVAYTGCVDCLVANNTFVNPARRIVRILQETLSTPPYEFLPVSNGRFLNNVVWFSDASVTSHVNVGSDTAPETFAFEANLWYAHDAPGMSTPSLPVQESGGVYGEDPAFVDLSSGDFSLSGGSPAIGAGVDIPELSGDADGACWAVPPSIGAYEGAPPL